MGDVRQYSKMEVVEEWKGIVNRSGEFRADYRTGTKDESRGTQVGRECVYGRYGYQAK